MNTVSIFLIFVLHVLVVSSVKTHCGSYGCFDSIAQKCRKRGYQYRWEETTKLGFKLIKWCQIPKDATKQIVVGKAKCPSPSGMVLNGKSWTNKTTCYRFTCTLSQPSGRIKYPRVHITPKSIGCPYKGGCVDRGKTWKEEKGIFKLTYQCTHVGGPLNEKRFIRLKGISKPL